MPSKAPARAPKRPKQADAFVLDGSVALAWFFEDEMSAYAESVEDSLERTAAVVPSLWALEVANALLVGERRKRTTAEKATEFTRLLSALPITFDDQASAHAFPEILSLARTHGLSAYDAAYLELALRRALPLASLDRRLKTAARAAGVALYAA
jgi:predicted nucleic acid-binding protein